MSDDKPETIPGAKLGTDGIWRGDDGEPLSNADLIRLREKAARERERVRRERERAKKEAGE